MVPHYDVQEGTVTGVVKTLEKRGLVERTRMDDDRRRVMVSLTAAGLEMMEQLLPEFNRYEAEMVRGMSHSDKRKLAGLLRRVIVTAGTQ